MNVIGAVNGVGKFKMIENRANVDKALFLGI